MCWSCINSFRINATNKKKPRAMITLRFISQDCCICNWILLCFSHAAALFILFSCCSHCYCHYYYYALFLFYAMCFFFLLRWCFISFSILRYTISYSAMKKRTKMLALNRFELKLFVCGKHFAFWISYDNILFYGIGLNKFNS